MIGGEDCVDDTMMRRCFLCGIVSYSRTAHAAGMPILATYPFKFPPSSNKAGCTIVQYTQKPQDGKDDETSGLHCITFPHQQ